MSSEFYPPLRVNTASHRGPAAVIIAVYCLPLPAVAFAFNAFIAASIAAAALVCLAVELCKQRFAASVAQVELTATQKWLVHRAMNQVGYAQLCGHLQFGRRALLHLKQDGKKFRVLINATGQDEQFHRLRVLLANLPGDNTGRHHYDN